jgi:hypothetical protein
VLLGRGFKNYKTSLGLPVGDGHKDLRGFISGQFIVSGFDGWRHGTIKQIFMECEVCGKPSKKRAKSNPVNILILLHICSANPQFIR